ncbi:MAG: PDGLE domain-containing protein [Ignisphaera sp.]|uniref:Cobalamin biosynthesis protein n=1 Tax=Ignisphaera aggregans TaxID=334771 RepID=A0A7J3JSA6_9CREN
MSRRHIYLLIALIVISPVFGVYLANLVGYHEPLDIIAEELGLSEAEFNWTPLKDYMVPGLPEWLGYILTGIIGVSIMLLLEAIVRHFILRKNK